MHPSGQPPGQPSAQLFEQRSEQMLGSTGSPYHHPLPPNDINYHGEQVATTSHPSWHTSTYSELPTPSYPSYTHLQAPHPQQHPNYPPVPSQQQHPHMTPQALLTQQQQQQVQQQQQQRSAYSSPSSNRPPSAPVQNQKSRTEQWVQSWPYAHSPAPSVAPSVMSYHQNDDRMSMLSVNTAMTNQFPDSQRCFSSNGSTCENVNPESSMAQANLGQVAHQAMIEWFNTQDHRQRFNMATTIREWVRRDKFASVPPEVMPNCIQRLLAIIHDGMRMLPDQIPPIPPTYYGRLFCYLLDILLRLTYYPSTIAHMNLVLQLFTPQENTPNNFRDLICNAMNPDFMMDEHFSHAANGAYKIFENIIQYLNIPKHEKLRADFAKNLKFPLMVMTLMKTLQYPIPPSQLNSTILHVLRFIVSKDTIIKDQLIWCQERQRDQIPRNSILIILKTILVRCHQQINDPELANRNLEASRIVQLVTRTFEFLNMLLYDSNAIDAYVKPHQYPDGMQYPDGIQMICSVLNYQNDDLTRSGFKLLLRVSDSKGLCLVNLKDALPFIMGKLRESLSRRADDVVYSGTGFLSNVVADKLPVKQLAIANGAVPLLLEVLLRFTPLSNFADAPKKKLACGIICNSFRAMNNFLLMWIPTQNGQKMEMGQTEKEQVSRFLESDVLKRLMICLSLETFDACALFELRSIILRFFLLILRTPSISKEGLLTVTDDFRKKNLVGHIAISFSWADVQPITEKTKDAKQLFVERVFILLVRLMEQFEEDQVAHSLYSISCPLSVLNTDQTKPQLIFNVLRVCDKILQHCPTLADGWSIYSSLVEIFKNHSIPDIEQTASSLLRRFPMSDTHMDEGILQSAQFTQL